MTTPHEPTTMQTMRDELEWQRQCAILRGEWDEAAHYAELIEATAPDHVAPVRRDCPYTHPFKARRANRRYYRPGTLGYDRAIPDFCFVTEATAQAAGYRSGR